MVHWKCDGDLPILSVVVPVGVEGELDAAEHVTEAPRGASGVDVAPEGASRGPSCGWASRG